MDEKESMRMVIRAIERNSIDIDQAGDIVRRLINLFNSDDTRQYLKDKKQQAREGLLCLEKAMDESLYQGMKAMQQLVQDTHIHVWSGDSAISQFQFNAKSFHYLFTRAFDVLKNDSLTNREKVKKIWEGITDSLTMDDDKQEVRLRRTNFLHIWRQNVSKKLQQSDRKRLEQQIIKDSETGFGRQSSELEQLIDQLRQHFDGLRCKMVGRQENAAASHAAATKRENTSCFPNFENSLFDYIRGNIADKQLRKLIKDNRLEEDLHHIREHLQSWISSCRQSLDEGKIMYLNTEAFVLEARRLWAFTKALLLDDSEYIEEHSELLLKLTDTVLSAGDDVFPFISIGHLPEGSQTVKLTLIVGENADMVAVRAVVNDIAKLARRDKFNQISEVEGCHYNITFTQTDDTWRFIDIIAKQPDKLADVHVRAALLGEYDIDVESRLTNTAYNRIYGRSLTAPGFNPTIFNFLDYNGETYYCPTGWRRIGIRVADSAAEFDQMYGGWHVAYHGTKHMSAASILTEGLRPGKGCYSEKNDVAYFSPSIEYASHPRYAKVYEHRDNDGAMKHMQMVFQVRVNPANIWKKEGGTLPGSFDRGNSHYVERRDRRPADPNYPENLNLEWLVKPIPGASGTDMFRNKFVIYGIMIRVSDTHPENHLANAWWYPERRDPEHRYADNCTVL